ncbi:mCG146248, partial [Mus musculus]
WQLTQGQLPLAFSEFAPALLFPLEGQGGAHLRQNSSASGAPLGWQAQERSVAKAWPSGGPAMLLSDRCD